MPQHFAKTAGNLFRLGATGLSGVTGRLRRRLLSWTGAALMVAIGGSALATAGAAQETKSGDDNSPGRGDLVLELTGFENTAGRAVALLYFLGDPLREPSKKIAGPIRGGQAVITFRDVPHGDYGLIAFHDRNGNDEPDHNWLGIPKEPMVFSAGFEMSFFSGPPSFDDLKFPFKPSNTHQRLRFD